MNKLNEGSVYLNKYISDSCINYPINGIFNYSLLSIIFERIVPFERPDFYSIVGDTIYAIEHFEIDSSKHNKNGSKKSIEESMDNSKFNKFLKGKKIEDYPVLYNGQIDAEPKIEYYKENLFNTFESHYKKIDSYKKHLEEVILNFERYKVVTIFLIEDSSIFGSLYFKNGIKLLLPVLIKEFNELYKTCSDLDLIICSSETNDNKKVSWALARTDIEFIKSNEISYDEIELLDMRPMSVGASIFVPLKKKKLSCKL